MACTHALAALALLALNAPAQTGSRLQGDVSASLSSGYDSNPRRTIGEDSTPDGFLSLTGNARGRLALGEGHQLTARYDLGLRGFLVEHGENVAVQQADLEYAARIGDFVLGASAAGKVRLSREANRDYLDGVANALVDWQPNRTWLARLNLGVRGFAYPPDHAYDSSGPQAGATFRFSPTRHHSITAAVSGALPGYSGMARLESGELSTTPRRDSQIGAQIAFGYRGPVAVQAGYAWALNRSNSFGESAQRHRLSGALTAQLPGQLFGMIQAAWQVIRYPDGLPICTGDRCTPQDLLLLDDESQSSLVTKLAWPINDTFDLEGRYALYWIELPPPTAADRRPLTYVRHIAGLGVAARW